jgi:hypothetical protein
MVPDSAIHEISGQKQTKGTNRQVGAHTSLNKGSSAQISHRKPRVFLEIFRAANILLGYFVLCKDFQLFFVTASEKSRP